VSAYVDPDRALDHDVAAARPPLASGCAVGGPAFRAHPDRDGARPRLVGGPYRDEGGRPWSIQYVDLTAELVAVCAEADLVLGIARLDPPGVVDVRDALAVAPALAAGAATRPGSWETALRLVRTRSVTNLGRVTRLAVELDVAVVGAPDAAGAASWLRRQIPLSGSPGDRNGRADFVRWSELGDRRFEEPAAVTPLPQVVQGGRAVPAVSSEACPACNDRLVEAADGYVCSFCGRRFRWSTLGGMTEVAALDPEAAS
jgi:hypothetical protein